MPPRLPVLSVSLRPLRPGAVARRHYATKPPTPTSRFYKTFSRPIAKVLLMAVFTYQVAYWAWVKLDTEEVRAETEATIKGLEGEVRKYEEAQEQK